MPRVLLINTAEPEETRAALVEEGRVEEFRRERPAAAGLVGNIYKGRVVNLEKSIGAAFLDVGVGRNGFLHVSACAAATQDDRIEDHCTLGEPAVVQVTRESIGPKGPVLTAEVSLPGRLLVLLPGGGGGGISRRIAGEEDRPGLKALVRELEKRSGCAVILRTAGAGATKRELLRELRQLQRLWAAVEARATEAEAPALLHSESDLVGRALRDMADHQVEEIWVDTPEAFERARETAAAIQPGMADRLRLHEARQPLFHAFAIEEQIDVLRSRSVPLPGGGSVVFDRTEALVAVDVNSGRRDADGLEAAAFATNLEAAVEIARQLRLRDLGGVVVVDFIDMRQAEHNRQVERAFREALRRDRARVRPGRMGPFGIFALTRRRTGAGAEPRRPCPRCAGAGAEETPAETALRVFRELRARAAGAGRKDLRARVGPEAAAVLEGLRGGVVKALEEESGRRIRVRAAGSLPPGAWAVDAV